MRRLSKIELAAVLSHAMRNGLCLPKDFDDVNVELAVEELEQEEKPTRDAWKNVAKNLMEQSET